MAVLLLMESVVVVLLIMVNILTALVHSREISW
jgi:hypothetical protein